MREPKILIPDIETFPLEAYVWPSEVWHARIGPKQLIRDTTIASFAAKWLGKEEVIYQDTGGSRNVRNDKPLLRTLHKLLNEADIVVVQNGKAFDIPKIRSRMVGLGFPPFSGIKIVDTKLEAKKQFGFTYNSLEHLGEALGCDVQKDDHAEFPGLELWKECLKNNPRAWKTMKKYNIGDVLTLEQIYLKLRPWMVGHPNVGLFVDGDEPVCPKCGSKHLIKRGYTAANVFLYNYYQCKDCRGYSRGRQPVNRGTQQLVN